MQESPLPGLGCHLLHMLHIAVNFCMENRSTCKEHEISWNNQGMQGFSTVTERLDFLSAAMKDIQDMLHLRDASITQIELSSYISLCFVSIIYMFIFQVNIYIVLSP